MAKVLSATWIAKPGEEETVRAALEERRKEFYETLDY